MKANWRDGSTALMAFTVLAASVLASLSLVSTASAYEFGTPAVAQTGPEETVFDWSTMACSEENIPDLPARVFRDASNRIQLILSHLTNYRMTGPSLDSLSVDCNPVMRSGNNPDPAMWDDKEWIGSTYTSDGSNITALVHEEFHGWDFPGMCATQGAYDPLCWYNAITVAKSTDGGASYTHATPPLQRVASVPYPYVPDSDTNGAFQPSNIIRFGSYYYTLVHVENYELQQRGACVMRTDDLDDAASWRAWDGASYSVRFIDPYLEPGAPPDEHVCKPVAALQIGKMSNSLTYNSYLHKFLLVSQSQKLDPTIGESVFGFYYSTSSDLVNWPQRKLFMKAPLNDWQCGDPDPVGNPALIDPDSTSRNFDTTDQNMYLYFSRVNPQNCVLGLNRDLVRIPVKLSDQVAGGPTASFTAAPNPATTGQTVNFDASASSDSDGTIADYQWDLDGDGSYETDSGTEPTTSKSYSSTDSTTVTLRVTDNSGKATTTTEKVSVGNHPPGASFTATPNPALTDQTVSFDASASSDQDGTIANYRWDLDGNGSFETDTGASATATDSYATAGPVTVGLRVTDDAGATDQATRTVTVTATNSPPVASFTATPNPALTGQSVSFNASGSSDPDGTIANYKWDLDGNGSFETDTGTSATATNAYATAGPVMVGLRVTDDAGVTDQATRTVTVTNRPPVASFTATPNPALTGQSVSFNASGSSDPDGTIANYKWDLDGNGTFETDTGTSTTATNAYATAGPVTVAVRVTDDAGATDQATRTVTVSNRPPVASFTAAPNPALTGQSVSFNGSGSSDPDGTIANYKWDLDGNGSFETDTGTTPTASRSYSTSTPANVAVKLRVTDNSGATTDATVTLTVSNRPPVASFTATPNPALTGQSVSFNGSGSSDPDGTIANYKWDLDGNGTFETDTGTTPTASRSYSTPANVAVKLRVTDNSGATKDATVTLTVRYLAQINFQPASAPVPAGYVADTGASYNAVRGSGWIREDSLSGVHVALDLTPNTFDRNLVTDQRLDTLIYMDAKAGGGLVKTPAAWEIAVPNGSYTVTVSVGDAANTDSTNRINIEGQNAIAGFKPNATTKFASATKVVTVADGRLTVDAKGGTNTKLDYVTITGN